MSFWCSPWEYWFWHLFNLLLLQPLWEMPNRSNFHAKNLITFILSLCKVWPNLHMILYTIQIQPLFIIYRFGWITERTHGSTVCPLQKGVKHLKKYKGDAKQPKTNTKIDTKWNKEAQNYHREAEMNTNRCLMTAEGHKMKWPQWNVNDVLVSRVTQSVHKQF